MFASPLLSQKLAAMKPPATERGTSCCAPTPEQQNGARLRHQQTQPVLRCMGTVKEVSPGRELMQAPTFGRVQKERPNPEWHKAH